MMIIFMFLYKSMVQITLRILNAVLVTIMETEAKNINGLPQFLYEDKFLVRIGMIKMSGIMQV